MQRSTKFRAGCALIGLALTAAACGGSGSSTTSDTIDKSINNAIQGQVTTTVAGQTATSAKTTLKEPTSMDEWEKLWETERAAVVKRIKDNKWGISPDGKSVTGAEGFKVDLSKCPSGWSNTEGLTDTTFKIGGSLSLSGTLADYGNYGKSIDTLFDYYSKKGMFKDSNGKTRTAQYISKDDGYDPARAIPNVDELLDSEKVFDVWTLGTGSTLKVYDKVNQRCVPHLLAMTGHPAWGDPVNHPWTTGAPVPSYTTETQLWGSFIEGHLSEFTGAKIKVAALVMNNDFGKVYEAGFKSFLSQSATLKDKVEFITETIEPSAPTIKDPMTTMAAKNPDVFIAMTAGTSCTQAVTEASENGMKEKVKYLFQPLTCTGVSFVAKEKVGGDGAASNGWWIFNPGIKDIKDASIAGDPWMKFIRGLLTDKGLNPDSTSSLGAGFGYAWPMVQSLIIAGQLDGGLTRANLLVAHRAIDMTPPTHVWGLRSHLNGNKDSFIIEGGLFAKFDSAKQTWINQGNLIDLDGKSSNCSWDQATSTCKIV